MSDYLVEQLADIRSAVADLKRGRVTYKAAEVTAADAATGSVNVVLPEGDVLTGVPGPSGQLLPEVGQTVRLRLEGATVVYEAAGISENAVDSRELAPGAVLGENIASAAVTAAKLAVAAISSETGALANGSVTETTVADDAITTPKIAANAVTAGELAANSVTAEKIQALAVTAEKLEALLVLASEIIAGDAAGNHARMSSTGFRTYAPDPAGGVYEVTRQGTGGDDVIGVSGPDGTFRGGFDPQGRVIAQGGSVSGDLTVMGRLLVGERLAQVSAGLVANGGASFPGLATDVEYEMMEVPFQVTRADRSYRLRCGGFGAYVEHTGAEISLRVRYTTDGSEPTVASPTLFRTAIAPHAANYWVYPEINEPAWYAENAAAGTTFRLLATLQRTGPVASRAVIPSGAAFVRLSVEDTGPRVPLAQKVRSGTSGGTGSTAPSQLRYVTDTTSNWSRTWRGNGTVFTDADAYQGSYGDSNGNMYSLIGFPDMTAQLAGATIEAIQVYLYAHHWYYNAGGTAVIGVHGHTTTPGSVSLAQYDKLRVSEWPRAAGKWVTLPSSLYQGFKDGSFRGITLGPGPTTDREYYGRFAGGNASIVRLTYVK